jgi:hypothetical protein
VGTLKGVGRSYQQTFSDTYSKVAFAKLYDRKTSLTAADLLNAQVVPFFDTHEVQQFPVIELERLRAYRQEPVESTGRRFLLQKSHGSRSTWATDPKRAPVGVLLQPGFDPQPG